MRHQSRTVIAILDYDAHVHHDGLGTLYFPRTKKQARRIIKNIENQGREYSLQYVTGSCLIDIDTEYGTSLWCRNYRNNFAYWEPYRWDRF